jgi:hypothetical protein
VKLHLSVVKLLQVHGVNDIRQTEILAAECSFFEGDVMFRAGMGSLVMLCWFLYRVAAVSLISSIPLSLEALIFQSVLLAGV